LTYAKSFRSAASRVTASASAAEDPVPEPLVESEAETSEPRVSEETSESEESFAPRASPRSVSLSLAESWPTMMSASDRPESTEPVPPKGEGDRFGDRRSGDPGVGEVDRANESVCESDTDEEETFPEDPNPGRSGTVADPPACAPCAPPPRCSDERGIPIPARHVGDPDASRVQGPPPGDPSEPCEEDACLFGRVGLTAKPGGGDRHAPAGAPPCCPPGDPYPLEGPSMERTLRRSDAAAPASSSEEAASEAAREDGCSELA
jgi:hypothetical protein